MKLFFVYILANKPNGTLYIGVTSRLKVRVWQHKTSASNSFTHKYKVNQLIYYECFESARTAIQREKRLKKWRRKWKLALIESTNPDWDDLYDRLEV